jgi:hypothetical protein
LAPLFFLGGKSLGVIISPLLGAFPEVEVDLAELLDVEVIGADSYPIPVLL